MYILQDNLTTKKTKAQTQNKQERQNSQTQKQQTHNNTKGSITQQLEKPLMSTILTEWNTRHPIFKELTTEKHQECQSRLIQLMDERMANHPEEDTVIAFRELAKTMPWGPTTKDKYWASYISARKLINLPTVPGAAALQTILKRDSRLVVRWDPSDEAQWTDLKTLYSIRSQLNFSLHRWTMTIAILDQLIGHRASDLAMVEKRNIFVVNDFYVIRLVNGKTVDVTGPYTIAFSKSGAAGQALQALCIHSIPSSVYLMIASTTFLERPQLSTASSKISVQIRTLMRQFIPQWTIRALRRGGLSSMALCGIPEETIQTFGKHTTSDGLRRYLADGIFNQHLAAKQSASIDSMFANQAPLQNRQSNFGLVRSSHPTMHQDVGLRVFQKDVGPASPVSLFTQKSPTELIWLLPKL